MKVKSKKLFLSTLITIFLFIPNILIPSKSEILKMRTQEDIKCEIIKTEKDYILLKDKQKIKKDQVKEIIFAESKEKPKTEYKITEQELKNIKELYTQSDKFTQNYPGIDGVVLRSDGEYHLKEDGSYTFKYHFIGHILKESLKEYWGNINEIFEEGRSKSKIVKASVYHRDGKLFPLEEDKVKVSEPQESELFFTKYITLNYQMPEVEVDSIVEYIIETEEYNPFRKDFFFPRWGFQNSQPTKESTLKIIIPEKEELYFYLKNVPESYKNPKIENKDGEKIYTWTMNNIPNIVSEPKMVQYVDYAPYLKGSIFKDWNRVFKWLKEMHKKNINANTKLKKFTLDLVKDCKTPEEKLAKIYHYIQQKIRYIAIKMGVASGWGGYDANVTWEKQYGCCIDKALLFTAMLKVVGIESTPIILQTNDSYESIFEIPTVYFNHAISMVKLGNKRIFLDSTGSNFRFPYFNEYDHGIKCINVFDEKIDEVPTPSPEENKVFGKYIINIDKAGDTSVEYSNEYTGSKEAWTRGYYKTIKEEDKKRELQNWINDISPGGILKDYEFYNVEDISKPFYFKMNYELKNYSTKVSDLIIFNLPDFESRFNEVSLEKRKYDIEYPSSSESTKKYFINLPENYEIIKDYLPENINIENNYISFHSFIKIIDSRKLEFTVSFKRYKRIIPVKDYKQYREDLNKISRYTQNKLFFKNKDITTTEGNE